jgi:hypothetical protein
VSCLLCFPLPLTVRRTACAGARRAIIFVQIEGPLHWLADKGGLTRGQCRAHVVFRELPETAFIEFLPPPLLVCGHGVRTGRMTITQGWIAHTAGHRRRRAACT